VSAPRLEEVRDRLLEAEGELKKLATEIQLSGSVEKLDEWMGRVSDIGDILWEAENSIDFLRRAAEEDPVLDVLQDVVRYAREVADEIRKALKYAFEPDPVIDSRVEEKLEDLDAAVRKLTGQGCRYRLSPAAASRLSARLNDLASCIHRAAERILGAVRKIGRCDITANANPAAVRACAAWSVAADKLYDRNLYSGQDAAYLWGYVVGDRVYLRVGSSEGHRTVVDLKQGTLDYYDTDEEVNEAMKRLLEKIGLSCAKRSDGVTCRGVNPSNAHRAAQILAFATSMDFRIRDPIKYWGEDAAVEWEVSQAEKILKEIEPRIEQALREWGI